MSKKPTIHQKYTVASSRLFEIEAIELQFANGEERVYERLLRRGNGAVLIVPMLDDETLLLIREYSGGTDRYELGFPKGKVDAGESLLQAANRELMEEVGYEAASLVHLKSLTLAPQYMEHTTDIILARDLTPHREDGDEPEELEVVPWRLDQIETLVQQDDFSEGRSLAALFLAREYLNDKSHH
jgi:ADP-ribose diphosphatase